MLPGGLQTLSSQVSDSGPACRLAADLTPAYLNRSLTSPLPAHWLAGWLPHPASCLPSHCCPWPRLLRPPHQQPASLLCSPCPCVHLLFPACLPAEPGLSTIVTAVIGARKIFQRMTTYAKYTVAMTFRICFTFGLITVIYDWYEGGGGGQGRQAAYIYDW